MPLTARISRRAARTRLPDRGVAVLAAWLAAIVPAAAGGGALEVEDAWARASIGGASVSAVYLTLTNHGDAADRLLGVEVDRASDAMLHRSVVEEGIARMRHVPAVEVPPGETVRLEPGGLHVMLMGVSPRLDAGERLPVTLVFERAGAIAVSVPVRRSPPG